MKRVGIDTAHVRVQMKLTELETELLESNCNSEKLKRSYSELMEMGLVLHKVSSFNPIVFQKLTQSSE